EEQPAQGASVGKPPVIAETKATPATALAPARVGEGSRKFETGNLFVAILVLAGIGFIGWAIVFEIRRRGIHFPSFRRAAPAAGPQFEGMEYAAAPQAQSAMKVMPRLMGGPRQISLKLKASEPSLRRAVVPLGKPNRIIGSEAVVEPAIEGNGKHEPKFEPTFETFESVGPVVEQGGTPFIAEPTAQPEWFAPQPELRVVEAPDPVVAQQEEERTIPAFEPLFAHQEPIPQPVIEPAFEDVFARSEPIAESVVEPVVEPAFAHAEPN